MSSTNTIVPITDEMVERAAQELWFQSVNKFPYARLIDATKDDLRRYARAALEAGLKK